MRFLDEPKADRGVVTMTIDDALHIPPEERARIIAAYLPHEREARARGVPMLGSGRIFIVPRRRITSRRSNTSRRIGPSCGASTSASTTRSRRC
jgi:hypothetical protein